MSPSSVLPFMLEWLIKSGLILLVAIALDALWRRGSAAQRHALWLGAFAALLLLPFTKCLSPRWHLPVSPIAPVSMMAVPLSAEFIEPATAVTPKVRATPRGFRMPEVSRLVLVVWLVGAGAIVAYRWLGIWQVVALRRRSTAADERLAALARQGAAEMGLLELQRVWLAAGIRVPCTFGVWRPVVLLPVTSAREWAEDRLLAALRHEFAHVVRRDYLARCMGFLACALYWPNPLVWLAARRMHLAQEQACDDLVLQAGTPAADYAVLLVEVAREAEELRASVAMARPSTLEGRVLAIIDPARNRRPVGWKTFLTSAISIAAIVGTSALAQIAPQSVLQTPAPTPVVLKEAPTPAVLQLLPIRIENETSDDTGEKRTLHISIKAQPEIRIDMSQVTIQALFYDLVDGHDLRFTHANVRSHWLTAPANWAERDTEELAVDYSLPKSLADKEPERKYHGYIVRLYYQGQLQGAAGSPQELLQRFPSQLTLPDSETVRSSKKKKTDSPAADAFVRAVVAMDRAEKQEQEGDAEGAVESMRSALRALDEVTKLDVEWQPKLVALRRTRVKDAIIRLERKLAPAKPGVIHDGAPSRRSWVGALVSPFSYRTAYL